MERWILAINYDAEKFAEAQIEWLKYNVFIRIVLDISSAIHELMKNNNFLLVAIFVDDNSNDYLKQLPLLRNVTLAPILIIVNKYNGIEKVKAIEIGADEYIEWPENVIESVASGRALIRRYTELNLSSASSPKFLSYGDIFISIDYHKVFIASVEIVLSRREFDLFYLLVSNPDRVFRPEYLYMKLWGEDLIPTDNSLYTCIRRIRKKLYACSSKYKIENKRGVGYYFTQK